MSAALRILRTSRFEHILKLRLLILVCAANIVSSRLYKARVSFELPVCASCGRPATLASTPLARIPLHAQLLFSNRQWKGQITIFRSSHLHSLWLLQDLETGFGNEPSTANVRNRISRLHWRRKNHSSPRGQSQYPHRSTSSRSGTNYS